VILTLVSDTILKCDRQTERRLDHNYYALATAVTLIAESPESAESSLMQYVIY